MPTELFAQNRFSCTAVNKFMETKFLYTTLMPAFTTVRLKQWPARGVLARSVFFFFPFFRPIFLRQKDTIDNRKKKKYTMEFRMRNWLRYSASSLVCGTRDLSAKF